MKLESIQNRLRFLKSRMVEEKKQPTDSVTLGEANKKKKKKKSSKKTRSVAVKSLTLKPGGSLLNQVNNGLLIQDSANALKPKKMALGGGLTMMSSGNPDFTGMENLSTPIAIEEQPVEDLTFEEPVVVEETKNLDIPVVDSLDFDSSANHTVADVDHSQMMSSAMSDTSSGPEITVEEPVIQTESTADEVVENVAETVQETMGDGITAVNEQIEETSQQIKQLQAETRVAQEAIKQEAPKFSSELSVLLEQYQLATDRINQEAVQSEIVALLDGTPESLKAQVDKVREQTGVLFESTKTAWEAREAARDLNNPSATQLAKEHRERSRGNGSREQLLTEQYKDRSYQAGLSEKLRATGKSQTLATTLKGRGALD